MTTQKTNVVASGMLRILETGKYQLTDEFVALASNPVLFPEAGFEPKLSFNEKDPAAKQIGEIHFWLKAIAKPNPDHLRMIWGLMLYWRLTLELTLSSVSITLRIQSFVARD